MVEYLPAVITGVCAFWVYWMLDGLQYESCTLISIADGDTIRVNYKGKSKGVRLIGVDSPEKSRTRFKHVEPGGEAAAKFTEKRLKGRRKVYLRFDLNREDQYGRILAYVYYGPARKFLNLELVQNGHAKAAPFPPNKKFARAFKSAQKFPRFFLRNMWWYRYHRERV